MSLPSVEVVRQRIKSAHKEETRMCLTASYLLCARISEIISRTCPSDRTTSRGPRGTDVKIQTWKRRKVAVFRVKTAKRKGLVRLVALPLGESFEPLAKPLYDYFREKGQAYVFPFTRQKVWRLAKPLFSGLRYPIEKYVVFPKNGKLRKVVTRHTKPFNLHALRHLRASELVEVYGFNGIDLSTYGGWTLQRGAGLPSVMQRYLTLSWQSYFPKLLKKRN